MSEKKGFFRRVFSFGQPSEPERPVVPPAPEPVLPAPAPETEAPPPLLSPLAETDAPAADIPAAEVTEIRRDSDATPPAPAAAPAWLDPAAPEPAADFSWLDAPADEEFPAAEPLFPAAPDLTEPSAVASVAKAPVVPAVPLSPAALDEPAPSPAAVLDEAVAEGAGAVEGAPEAGGLPGLSATDDDFSFLAPDAPLPEEEADFSWLDESLPEEPAAPSSATVTAVATAGVASAAAAAATGEGGWRLREAQAPAAAPIAAPVSWFDRLREGLSRSSSQLSGSITALFTKRRLDEATLQEFEDVLIQADLGVETALRITDRLSEGRFGKEISGSEVRAILAEEVEATLRPVALPLELDLEKKPHVILVVGVNGTGKTTTIGKLAAKLVRGGLKVTLCAGDTFRAAAVEQLKIWGERTGSEVVAKAIGADAAGLAFEAYDRAIANDSDVLIIDTAGRLQNRTELMAELEKIVRVLQRREPDAPHTVLQTLDATTGQNALSQVEIFRNVAGVNGLVMTKLDGTARGGILVAIAAKYRLPVYFVGVGEGIDDLEPFKARDFAAAIAGSQ